MPSQIDIILYHPYHYFGTIDEHWNIDNDILEDYGDLLQAFTTRAYNRERRYKEVTAYNVIQYISCDSDVDHLQIP